MKTVPNFTAEYSLATPGNWHSGTATAAPGAQEIEGAIDIWCMVKCIGMQALGCAYCLTNPVCWATCAGPGAVGCISKCS